jgi:hypothetical protein
MAEAATEKKAIMKAMVVAAKYPVRSDQERAMVGKGHL